MKKNNLKELRKDRGMTQAQLAELMDFEQGTVQRHEAGTRDINTETIEKYAKALQCHPAEIISGNIMENITEDEKQWLDILRDIPADKRDLYLRMAEPFKSETFEHGAPQQSEKPTKDERKTS